MVCHADMQMPPLYASYVSELWTPDSTWKGGREGEVWGYWSKILAVLSNWEQNQPRVVRGKYHEEIWDSFGGIPVVGFC